MTIQELKLIKNQAMKDRDKDAVTALNALISKLFNESVEKKAAGTELTDADFARIAQKTVNELTEEREAFANAGRSESVASLDNQIATVKKYLPKLLSEDEITKIILSLPDKSVPFVMKHFKSEYNGKVDMKLVGEVLKKI